MENSTFVLSKMIKCVKNKLKISEYGATFWSGIIVGLITHGFVLTNKLINPDGAFYLFGKGGTISSGRWFLQLLSCVFPNFDMPWIYGIISIFLFTLSACIIIKIFDIKNRVLQGLVGALVISFPAITGTLGFMFTSTSYAVALLLIVVGFDLFKEPKFSCKTVIGIVFMSLSMGIYQSYLSVAASFAVLYLAKMVFDKESDTKDIIISGVRIFVFMLFASALYFLTMKLSLLITKTGFNSHAQNYMGGNESLKSKVVAMVTLYFNEYIFGGNGITIGLFSKILHILCFVFVAAFVVAWLFKKEKISKKIIMILLAGTFPIANNCLMLIVNTGAIHTIAKFSYISIYLLVIIIIEKQIRESEKKFFTLFREAVSVALAVIVCINVYVANEAYLEYYLRYENMYSYFTQMVTQVKMQPNYTSESKVAIVGKNGEKLNLYNVFGDLCQISFIGAMEPDMYSRDEFIKYFIGFENELVPRKEINKYIVETDEFKEMPNYPDSGSIRTIGDYIVVKVGTIIVQ